MLDRNTANENVAKLEKQLKHADRANLLILVLLICTFAKANFARDAWNALAQPDAASALAHYIEARGSVPDVLIAIGVVVVALVLYLSWLFAAVRNARTNGGGYDGPAPGTAILHHVLPPFVLMAPYQIMLSLYRSATARRGQTKDGAGVFVTSLWWGTLWLAIILEVIRQISSRGGDVEMSNFQLSFAVSSLGAICALSLAWLVWKISR